MKNKKSRMKRVKANLIEKYRNLSYSARGLFWCTLYPYSLSQLSNSYRFYKKMKKNRRESDRVFMNKKKSDTLGILGSGSTINDLSDSELDRLSKIDTIGLNFWCYHNFVPDFYRFEGIGHNSSAGWAIWYENISKKEYENTIFLANTNSIYNNFGNIYRHHFLMPQSVRDNVVYTTSYSQIVSKSEEFKKKHRKRFKSLSSPAGDYYAVKGSLSTVLQLAYWMNYKKIILYGIDLKDSKYFWSEWDVKDYIGYQQNEGKERHKTAKSKFTKGIHQYIYFLNNSIFKPEGIELKVASKKSLLYPNVDLKDQI